MDKDIDDLIDKFKKAKCEDNSNIVLLGTSGMEYCREIFKDFLEDDKEDTIKGITYHANRTINVNLNGTVDEIDRIFKKALNRIHKDNYIHHNKINHDKLLNEILKCNKKK